MKNVFTIIFFLMVTLSMAQVPEVSSGTIKRFEKFASAYVSPRNIDVWLPAGYDGSAKYNVLYMHDGQMLFDSSITWNKQSWNVDETIGRLINDGEIKDVIVVGIWNNNEYRHTEYFPEEPLSYLQKDVRDSLIKNELKSKPLADNYLLFITKELKPFIDSSFRTKAGRKNTFIGGSSMGGLISLYAICKYPEVFGGAACLSTHWPGSLKENSGAIPKAFNDYLLKHLPSSKDHKIYFDYGTATLEQLYEPHQLLIDSTMKEKGYSKRSWLTKKFEGEDHSEKAWSKRLHIPLLFLLKK